MPFTHRLAILPLLFASGLLIAALSWVASLSMGGQHRDWIVERGYYADPTGRETVETVQAKAFTPFSGPLYRGNDARPLWLRITLAPSDERTLALVYQPNFIHHIRTWLPVSDGGWRVVDSGIRHPYNERETPTLAPSVIVQPRPDARLTFYARLETPTTPFMVQAMAREDAQVFDGLTHYVAGFFIGGGLILAILSFALYAATLDRLWALDAAFNLCGLIVIAFQLGIVPALVLPDSGETLARTSLIVNVAVMALAALFYWRLFELFGIPRGLRLINGLSIAAVLPLLWLIVSGHGDWAMRLNNSLILLQAANGFFVLFRARHADRLMVNVFRLAYGGLLAYLAVWMIPVVLQLARGNLASLYPGLPIGQFSMLVLLLLLVRNTQLKLRTAQQAEQQRYDAELQLAAARQHHDDTHSFFGMLLHEVKNPLGTIRMATANLERELTDADDARRARLERVRRSVEAVDEVLERGARVDQFVQGALSLQLAPLDVAEFATRLVAAQPTAARLRLAAPARLDAHTDEDMIGLMLGNLLDNAAKYSPPDAALTLTLCADETRWRLTVANPPGAAGHPDPARLFAKYYRASAAMSQSGMGLGLYWVRGVARLMGGDVTYARGDDDQVVFELCLPI